MSKQILRGAAFFGAAAVLGVAGMQIAVASPVVETAGPSSIDTTLFVGASAKEMLGDDLGDVAYSPFGLTGSPIAVRSLKDMTLSDFRVAGDTRISGFSFTLATVATDPNTGKAQGPVSSIPCKVPVAGTRCAAPESLAVPAGNLYWFQPLGTSFAPSGTTWHYIAS